MKLKITKFRNDIIVPQRQHDNDTGADVYIPDDVVLKPFETKVIPLGFNIEVPKGYNARLQGRTSSCENGLLVHSCAIDSGYTGEIHLIVTNINKNKVVLYKNDRLAYLEYYACVYPTFIEEENDRKNGNFGSTGR